MCSSPAKRFGLNLPSPRRRGGNPSCTLPAMLPPPRARGRRSWGGDGAVFRDHPLRRGEARRRRGCVWGVLLSRPFRSDGASPSGAVGGPGQLTHRGSAGVALAGWSNVSMKGNCPHGSLHHFHLPLVRCRLKAGLQTRMHRKPHNVRAQALVVPPSGGIGRLEDERNEGCPHSHFSSISPSDILPRRLKAELQTCRDRRAIRNRWRHHSLT